MFCLYVCVFLYFLQFCGAVDNLQEWNYINLHCRDNDNKPVDWWYIYKPPSAVVPYLSLGMNFSYITPDHGGRWQSSATQLTGSAMLQHTLAPIFRATYTDYLALALYEEKEPSLKVLGSSALGILMGDELGGLWIGHTVPGFPDLTRHHVTFPEAETGNGHLMVCLSVDLVTLNEIAQSLKQAAPKFNLIHVPRLMERLLPDWNYLDRPVSRTELSNPKTLDFLSRYKTVRAVMMVRRPGEKHCLYRTFAQTKGIVLDVYGPNRDNRSTYCRNSYGVRNIDKISLKLKDSVHYVHPKTDRARFAVSTAAHWQRRGSSPAQYWLCTSNLDHEDITGKGGIILCIDSYDIWLSFDNFKVKEPEC